MISVDLQHIFEHTSHIWEDFRDQRLFITGGSGFFGCWLLESFLYANKKLQLNAEVVVLTRNINAIKSKSPHFFNNPALNFHEGDICNFNYPDGYFKFILHAATDTTSYLKDPKPLNIWDPIVLGTTHVLNFAKHCNAQRILFVGSGAVYGKTHQHITHIQETHPCQPQLHDARATYAIGKYAAEHLCCLYAKQYTMQIIIARCFAFLGPYLSPSAPFAMREFIQDALLGNNITIQGDGTPHRSYLYAADLAIWLWTLLSKGESCRVYNVGSDENYSIAEFATIVQKTLNPKIAIKVLQDPKPPFITEHYVPDITRARNELGLIPRISLAYAIKATANWYTLKHDSSFRN